MRLSVLAVDKEDMVVPMTDKTTAAPARVRYVPAVGPRLKILLTVVFGLFALQGLFNAGLVLISLLGTPFLETTAPIQSMLWKSLQFLLSCGNCAIYIGMALLVYAGMYDLTIAEYIPSRTR